MVKRVLALERVPSATTRAIVGIAGAPGSGKSTLAARSGDGPRPDGGAGRAGRVPPRPAGARRPRPRRGQGCARDVRRGRLPEPADPARKPPDGSTIYAPEFRREIEEPIAGAIAVPPTAEVIITEGNYLLLDTAPWAGVRAVATEVWYLDTPEDLRIQRLIDRHIRYGRSPEAARERAESGSRRTERGAGAGHPASTRTSCCSPEPSPGQRAESGRHRGRRRRAGRPRLGMPSPTPGVLSAAPASDRSPARVRRWVSTSPSATRWCGAA